jgi:hypothetical protein
MKETRTKLSAIAETVNLFKSEAVQLQVFRLLLREAGISATVDEDSVTDEMAGPDAAKGKRKRPASKTDKMNGGDGSLALQVVNAIKNYANFDNLEKKVIGKRAVLPRILMCYYFAREIMDSTLSTGEVETITDQLNIKITIQNVGATIKDKSKYFSTNTVRKQGTRTRYKINHTGIKKFEEILKGGVVVEE